MGRPYIFQLLQQNIHQKTFISFEEMEVKWTPNFENDPYMPRK